MNRYCLIDRFKVRHNLIEPPNWTTVLAVPDFMQDRNPEGDRPFIISSNVYSIAFRAGVSNSDDEEGILVK